MFLYKLLDVIEIITVLMFVIILIIKHLCDGIKYQFINLNCIFDNIVNYLI